MSTSSPLPPHLQDLSVGARGGRRAPEPVRHAHPFREKVRVTVRGIGEILITLGLVLLLYCGYQLWWTDVTSAKVTGKEVNQLHTLFDDTPEQTLPGKIQTVTAPAEGDAFALMYVPALGESWIRPIVQGVNLPDLHKGVGHYPKSAMPGQIGNFAVAGHRTTNGHPFRNVDKLQVGDKIFVETKYAWYTYTVTTVRKIVLPSDVYVVQPVPVQGQADATPTQRIMTMTSCNPPYSATQRIVTFSKLTNARPRGDGPPPGVPAGAS